MDGKFCQKCIHPISISNTKIRQLSQFQMSLHSQSQLRHKTLKANFSLAAGARTSISLIRRFLGDSSNIHQPNFTSFNAADLALLFQMLDQSFFEGLIQQTIQDERHDLTFRVSNRMTNSGGITTTRFPQRSGQPMTFEIAISSTLLFESFRDEKPIIVTGLLCGDRLQALKRIMEHEMIHLVEMLIWQQSSCSARRFQDIAKRIFSHRQSTHELITPRDAAIAKYKIATGDWVGFNLKGQQLFGYVNRITKRATVLVPCANGTRYSDGKFYNKFYVPVDKLFKAA